MNKVSSVSRCSKPDIKTSGLDHLLTLEDLFTRAANTSMSFRAGFTDVKTQVFCSVVSVFILLKSSDCKEIRLHYLSR